MRRIRIKLRLPPALLVTICTAITVISGCGSGDSLQQILDRGELRVVTTTGPATFYVGPAGPTGFEYALAREFAQELDVALRVTATPNRDILMSQLRKRQHDLAAAALSSTPERQREFVAAGPYGEVRTQVIYRTGQFRPRSVTDLYDAELLVLASSGSKELLERLQSSRFAELEWLSLDGEDAIDMLAMVEAGLAKFAVMDSMDFALHQPMFPRLEVAFEIGPSSDLVWLLPSGRDHLRLQARLDAFFARITMDGTLATLHETHFGHAVDAQRIESHTFLRAVEQVLPDYRPLIEAVARDYGIEWELLAAIAYQESHWNPRATSPTGVRGLMMLTGRTASELGIKNRLDPEQSLRGGARYLVAMRDRLPERIAEPDRSWMALAAYNIGPGHLEDARSLTSKLGGNPDKWTDVRDHLPLLQERRYYTQTRLGYARGLEPVNYVRNVRQYHKVLQWRSLAQVRPSPPVNPQDVLPEALNNLLLPGL